MESKTIRSNAGLTALAVLIWGIVCGSVISVVTYYLAFFTDIRLFSYLDRILEWPNALIPGFVIALIYAMCRRTTVTIGKEQIQISRGLHRWNLPVETFDDAATSKKLVNHSFLVLYFVKRHLVFNDVSGEKKYRIYDVTDTQMEDIVRWIREQKMMDMPIEEKVAIQNSLDKEEKGQDFHLNTDKIWNNEKSYMYKRTGIVFIVGVMLLLIGKDTMLMYVVSAELVAVIAILYGLSAPLQALYLKRKSKKCPEHIRICSGCIWVGDNRYSYGALSKIRLTSPRKKSMGAEPVNRYLWVFTNGEKTKYWLGSDVSFGEYGRLCDCLEKATFAYPGKVQYTKRFNL